MSCIEVETARHAPDRPDAIATPRRITPGGGVFVC